MPNFLGLVLGGGAEHPGKKQPQGEQGQHRTLLPGIPVRLSITANTGNRTSLARITQPNRIGRQRVHIHIRMPNQRHSLLGRLRPDESLALWGAVLVGGDGIGEKSPSVALASREASQMENAG